MTREQIDAFVDEHGYEGVLLADGFDAAFIGVVELNDLPVALYSIQGCIKILMDRDSMTEEDADEFFSFNVLGACVGPQTPRFVRTVATV